jgi:Zn-dependent protease with chaperone function
VIQAFLALLGTFIIAGLADWLPLTGPPRPLAWGAVCLLLPAVLSGARLLASGESPRALARVLRRSSLLAFLASYFAVLYPLGWARWALLDLGWRGRDLIALLFLLFPSAALALWAAPWTCLAERRARRAAGLPGPSFAAWLIGWARPVAVPGLAFLALVAAAERLQTIPSLAEALDSHHSLQALAACGGLLVLFAASPYLVLGAWPTRPVPPGPLAARFAEIAALLRVKVRSIRVWDERTRTLVNACVLGFLPGTRRVIFTRGICEHLEAEDLASVLSHELGHVARRHLAVHALVAFAFILGLAPIERATASLPGWAQGGAFAAYGLLYWGWFFGWLSRWFECEADLAGAAAVGVETYARTLRRVAALVGSAAGRGGWRHFSLERRAAMVAATGAPSPPGDPVTRRCRRFRIAAVLLAALSAGAWAWCAREDLARTEADVAAAGARAALAEAEDLRDLLSAVKRPENETPGVLSWLRRDAEDIARAYGASLARFQVELDRAARAEERPELEILREAGRALTAGSSR